MLMEEEDQDQVMELMWQNGQVVVHRPPRPPIYYIHEDEMTSWLHQPLDNGGGPFDRDFSSEIIHSAAQSALVTDPIPESIPHQPPQPHPRPKMTRTNRDFTAQRLGHFSNFVSPQPSTAIGEPASVVESNITPEKRASGSEGAAGRSGFVTGSSSVGGGRLETVSFEVTAGTATDASLAELDLEPLGSDFKKRKATATEADDSDCPSKDLADEAADTDKEVRPLTAKRTQAAEVHNLSERRRRDRINEKMKALQELLPRCNKSDKASMLDDAFEYLKSLQMQVQMMSMGMVPMMFPGFQQYMQMQPMGMGSGIAMNQPMMPFPAATPTHFRPRFPVPSYNPSSPFMPPNSPCIQVTNPVSTLNPVVVQNDNQQQVVQTIPDPYLSYQNSQLLPSKNGVKALPSANYTRPGDGLENPEKAAT